MKQLLVLLSLLALTGCATVQKAGYEHEPELAKNKMVKEFDAIPAPAGPKITVAVYSFQDKTGQRKNSPNIASFSSAVTQGAEPFLISALQEVGHGQWFDVVERVNVDNLIKERTIIKQMRDAYEGTAAKPLVPLQFAGIIIEGGIIGYDSGLESGGTGYNFLGIGPTTQYSKDVITISLRAVSVNTGKILASVTLTKTVYSTGDAIAIFKSIDPGSISSIVKQVGANNTGSTSAVAGIFQFESGLTINEATTIALKAAIESSVVELIKEGERKGVWEFKYPMPVEKAWYESKQDESKQEVKAVPVAEVKDVDTSKTPAKVTEPVIPLDNSKKTDVPEDQAVKEGVVK